MSNNSTSMNSWTEYLILQKERPELFIPSEIINIETDHRKIKEFEIKTGKTIGVVYKSDYNMMVVDLIKGKNGNYNAYERIVPSVKAAPVVIVTEYDGKYVMLKQFRHAIRKEQICFPRGFAYPNLSAKENAEKEVEEELGSKCLSIKPIGTISADSGLTSGEAIVFYATITKPILNQGHEGIKSIVSLTKKEVDTMLYNNLITDGFTIAALQLTKSAKTNN